ncbi:MAG: DUF2764 domain-containing protein [Bacteroidales bacterium]|jgi:hypothetical protein|nr:DUF2764 domain-containing protein [Bacteroidales bacterium]
MFKRDYHYLIAGLPDLALEQGVKQFDLEAFVREVHEHVSEKDDEYVRELFLPYDHLNIHNLLQKREDMFSSKGFFSLEFLKDHLDQPDEMPQYLIDIIRKFRLGHELGDRSDEYHNMAHYTWTRFYQEIEEKSTNQFIRSWFRFDQILRNIQSAWMCRKLGMSMQEQLVGWGEDIEFFVKNNLPDFGLRRELTLGEQIFNLLDEHIDIHEREFRFDEIRWQMADELTTFHYFDIDKVLAFLAKADILDRWLKLDKERGTVLFDGFVKNLVGHASANSAIEVKN